MEWISVKDRLPENRQEVLGAYVLEELEQSVLLFARGEFRTKYGSEFYGVVTHWMPLPEPPKT
jgi:hypothetical protein